MCVRACVRVCVCLLLHHAITACTSFAIQHAQPSMTSETTIQCSAVMATAIQLRRITWHYRGQGHTGGPAAHLVNGGLPPGLLLFCNQQLFSCSLQDSRTAHSSWESLAQSQGDQLGLKLKLNLKLAVTSVTVHNRQRCKYHGGWQGYAGVL